MSFPGGQGYISTLFGRLTDVNLWSRSLTEEEAQKWTRCQSLESLNEGDLVDWRTAEVAWTVWWACRRGWWTGRRCGINSGKAEGGGR